jgi:hypothetical protein
VLHPETQFVAGHQDASAKATLVEVGSQIVQAFRGRGQGSPVNGDHHQIPLR